jgi:hypothetical protein
MVCLGNIRINTLHKGAKDDDDDDDNNNNNNTLWRTKNIKKIFNLSFTVGSLTVNVCK